MDIQESLNQILQCRDKLGELFYSHFLEKFPELRKYFQGVNMQRQGVLLTTALMVIQRHHVAPTPAVDEYLRYLGTKHDELDIPREAYSKWTEAMLETLGRFHGEKWSDELGQQWRDAIETTVELMFQGYEQRVTI